MFICLFMYLRLFWFIVVGMQSLIFHLSVSCSVTCISLSLSHYRRCAQSMSSACCTLAATAAAQKPTQRSFEEVSSSDAKTNTTGDLHECLRGDSDWRWRAHDLQASLLFFFFFFFLFHASYLNFT